MLDILFALLASVTGRRFWYRVRLRYYDHNNRLLFSYQCCVGHVRKSYIMNERCNKYGQSNHIYNNRNMRKCLCNGILAAGPVCYLGWFKRVVN